MKNKTIIVKVITLLLLILGGSGLCLSGEKAEASDWYSPDWGYRKAITVDNTANASALTNYQVLVTLNASNFTYANAKGTNGSDLRFTSSDEITEISYWVEEWNTSGDSKIWVEVPSISASSTATIYLYYGNSSATTSLSSFDDTMQKLEADDDTAGLWHFDEGTRTSLGDSANTNNGTLNNFAEDGSDWVADSAFSSGGSLSFDGVDSYIEIPDDPSLNFGTGDFTIELWAKAPEDTTGELIQKFDIDDGSKDGAGFLIWAESSIIPETNDLGIKFSFIACDTDDGSDEQSGDEVPYGSWYYITAVRIDGTLKFYRDSNLIEEGINIVSDVDNIEALLIGTGDDGYFKGFMDELKISARALSVNEIKANYERRQYTATEPTSSLGSEETTPYDTSEMVVAADGGTVTNTADTAEVTIPADALSSDTDITIETSEETGNFQVQGAEPVDYIYNFGPEGTEFSSPVTLVFNYDDTGMTSEEESNLDIYYYNTQTSQWESQGATINTTLNTLTISVDHFCEFIVGINTANIALGDIGELLLLVDDYSEDGKIRVMINEEIVFYLPAYFLKVHLKRAQKLVGKGENGKAVAVLEKFVEKVERFTPHLIDEDASGVIIADTNTIISLLE